MVRSNISDMRNYKSGSRASNILLFCGVFSTGLWIAADILASLLTEGYSYFHQAPSELSAIGAPTVTLLNITGFVYNLLIIAFGFGVRKSVSDKPSLRITGSLLMAYGIISFAWYFVPMHPRGTDFTVTDIFHIGMAVVAVVMVLLIVGFGSNAFGSDFRNYSILTLLLLIVFGTLTFLQADRIAADQPTPWVGVYERINIYAYMIWIVVLSLRLLYPVYEPENNAARYWP